MFGEGGLEALRGALGDAARAVSGDHAARTADRVGVPAFVAQEVADLHRALRSEEA